MMFPFASIFTRKYRPEPVRKDSILDEEFEWVYGRKSPSSVRTNRVHPAEDQNQGNASNR